MDEDVNRVFSFWVEKHFSGRGKSPVLTTEREKKIRSAITNYGIETVLLAVDGCSRSDWHMGNNPGGKKYNDISLILRNAEKIEGFAAMANDDPVIPSTKQESPGDWITTLVDRTFALWNIDPNKPRRTQAYDAWRSVLHDLSPAACDDAVTFFAVAGSEFMPKPGEVRRRVLRDKLTAPAPLEAWLQVQASQKSSMNGTHATVLHRCVWQALKRVGGGAGLHTNGDREMFVAIYLDVVREEEATVLAVNGD